MLVGEWLQYVYRRPMELPPDRDDDSFDTLVTFESQPTTYQRVPLTLVAGEHLSWGAQLRFDANVFSHETIARLTVHYRTLLGSLISQPGAPLVELRMLPEHEEAWLIRELNQTEAKYSIDRCIHRSFESWARQAPDRTAAEYGDVKTSFGEVERQANRYAAWLQANGVEGEDIIGVSMPRSPALVISILAVLKAGGAFLPIDPSLPPDRIAAMIGDARPKFVLCGDTEAAKFVLCGDRLLNIDRSRGEVELFPDEPFLCPATADHAAYVIYTSRSTGKPKAAVVTHRSLVNYVEAARAILGITENDRRLQFASIGSDVFVAEIFNFLSSGGTLIFPRQQRWETVQDFLRVLDETKATITAMSSTWWQEWVAAMLAGRNPVPSSLRTLSVGLERVNPIAFRNWRRLVGDRVAWRNAYGPTETTRWRPYMRPVPRRGNARPTFL
jgi:non-ribosomal peptide synthetase component F